MAVRTVRLDDQSEAALAEVVDATQRSVSDVLKEGLMLVRDRMRERVRTDPFEVYRVIDLGPGGYARAPARDAKRAIQDLLRKRRG